MAAHCGPIIAVPAQTDVRRGESVSWSYAPGVLIVTADARVIAKLPMTAADLRRMLEYAEAAESEGA